jgi:hypothetical protein
MLSMAGAKTRLYWGRVGFSADLCDDKAHSVLYRLLGQESLFLIGC